jgi:hypothetical protein
MIGCEWTSVRVLSVPAIPPAERGSPGGLGYWLATSSRMVPLSRRSCEHSRQRRPSGCQLGHHGHVSIPIRFFSAPDDAGGAEALDRDPGSVQETMIRDRFLASSAMTEWETILTGRSPEGHAQAAPPLVVADDRPRSASKILAASPGLRAALAAADQSRLAGAARQWAGQYGAQHGNFEVSEVEKIFCEMSRLARMADAEQAGVYFWMR